MANRLEKTFDWCFYNIWQKVEWALFPLLAVGVVVWCLSALYWSPDPVSEKYKSPHNSNLEYALSNQTSNVLWFSHVNKNSQTLILNEHRF